MPFRGPFTRLYCHIVWATWERHPLITAELEPRLHGMLQAKLREIGCTPIATGGIEDHVHVLCEFPPTLAISELVKRIKGSSSHFMNDALGGPEHFRWQGTYGAVTVSESAIAKVREYVLNQRNHHSAGTEHSHWERVWLEDSSTANRESA